ncbi:MAG: ABC transporter substrate-binding protein [Oscillospiraceae bacterium]|nr:ABC transporter substrate-binding protein [Oscillospiraceae bacterium]
MKKVFSILLVVAMMAAMFVGCGSSSGFTSDPNAIKIGMTGPLTGGAAVYGTAVEAGMKIAVAEINAAAGEDGLKIEFQSADDEHDTEKALNAYNTLKDKGMQFFGGCVTTNPCLSVAPACVEDQMFMMTPSGSSEKIALTGDNVYQMCFTDPNQGASAAQLVYDKQMATQIGIIYDSSDDYSKGLMQGFKDRAAELGMDELIVVETSFTADNKSDLSTQVTQCKDAGCDFVFLPFYYTEAAQILTYANKIGYSPIFFGCDGMDGILGVDGFDTSLAEGLVLMTPFNADAEENQSFVEQYKEMMNGEIPNQFAADGYDVIYAIYNACVATGVDGATSVADACAKLQEYFATESFNGLTGTGMTWDANGMISKIPTAVVITDGKYVAL